MEALLAGFVAGLAMGILAVALLGAEIVRHPKAIQQFHGRFPKGTSLPQLMAGMALSLRAGWAQSALPALGFLLASRSPTARTSRFGFVGHLCWISRAMAAASRSTSWMPGSCSFEMAARRSSYLCAELEG